MASPASPDSARAYYTESIDLENQSVPFTKTDPKAKNRCVAPIDARYPAKRLAKRRHHHRRIKKATFEVFSLLLFVVVLLSLFADEYCHQKRTGTSWIGFSGVTRAPNGRMHFCADWRSSGQQLNENRTPSAFSKSDHDIADAMWVSTTAVSFLFRGERREMLGCSRGGRRIMGKKCLPRFLCVLRETAIFYMYMCALEMKKISKARSNTSSY